MRRILYHSVILMCVSSCKFSEITSFPVMRIKNRMCQMAVYAALVAFNSKEED